MDVNRNLNERWMHAACVIVGSDHALLREANAIDRMHVGSLAIVLLLEGCIALVGWIGFLWTFLPPALAMPIGMVLAGLVFMFDRAISASDWTPSGVLASGQWSVKRSVGLLLRVIFATILAIGTATGVVLAVSRDAIDDQIQRDRVARNQPLIEEFATRRTAMAGRILGAQEAEVAALSAERDRLQRAMKEGDSTVSGARRRAGDARVEASRERDGGLPNYRRGEGPRFRDAQRLEHEADTAARAATQDAAEMQRRFDALGPLMAEAGRRLAESSKRLAVEEQRIKAEMEADPRWYAERQGTLSRWVAFEKLRHDAEYGPTVREFDWKAKAILLAFELMFMCVKVFFSPASVYLVRLIARTRLDAARTWHEHEDQLQDLRSRQNVTPTMFLQDRSGVPNVNSRDAG